MNLSPHFTLAEMVKSSVALRKGLDNTPPPEVIANLKALCENVLEPVRSHFGMVTINSGYRSPAVNRAAGSKTSKSQHVSGHAADFECPGTANAQVADWIRRMLKFDQLILEFHTPGDPHSGWVHVSWAGPANRNHVLTISKDGTFQGLRT